MAGLLNVYGNNPPDHGPKRSVALMSYVAASGPNEGRRLVQYESPFTILPLLNPICAVCKSTKEPLLLCDTCLQKWYCNEECHKKGCCAEAERCGS